VSVASGAVTGGGGAEVDVLGAGVVVGLVDGGVVAGLSTPAEAQPAKRNRRAVIPADVGLNTAAPFLLGW